MSDPTPWLLDGLPRAGRRTLYVIEPQPHHERGLLRSLTAPHLLTLRPTRGDQILAALDVSWFPDPDTGRLHLLLDNIVNEPRAADPDDRILAFRLTTHAGHAAMLGDDTADDSYGGDLLEQVGLELARGGELGWAFAPCVLALQPFDDCSNWRRLRYHHLVAVELGEETTQAVPVTALVADGWHEVVDAHGCHWLALGEQRGRPVHRFVRDTGPEPVAPGLPSI